MKNNNKSLQCRVFLSATLLALSCQSFGQTQQASVQVKPVIEQNSIVQEGTAEVAAVLSDKLHQINRALENPAAVHSYSFTAVRGQDVLLATPSAGYNKQWRAEYRVDTGEWKVKHYGSAEKIAGLKPGSQVSVCIVATPSAQFDKTDYRLVLGSFPRMRYDLHNEKDFLPIPYGFTKPEFLATQAFKEALLEASFTDSKGVALEGGVLYFVLELNSKLKIKKTLISDKEGRISDLIEFPRCEGGWLAVFVHYSNGKHTWSTRYHAGTYSAAEVLSEHLADKPHLYNFGHICNRWLSNWSRQ